MDFPKIDRTIVLVQYRLLSHQSVGPANSYTAFDAPRICAVGALVYLQTIHRFHLRLHSGVSASVLMDRALIERLKMYLDSFDTALVETRELFLWMIFIGGVAVTGSKERAWFVAKIAKAVVELHIRCWDEAKSMLTKFLWIDSIHEGACRDLWEGAQVTVSVLFGGNG